MTRFLVVLALALAACGGAPRVPDKMLVDTTKLDPQAAASLTSARQELDQSRGSVGAATEQVAQAKQEEQVAEVDQKKAEVEVSQAKKALEDAEKRYDAAKARRAYTEKLVEAREAAEKAAKSRVEFADAKLEHAKVVAIQQVNATGAEEYRRSDFTARVADTQRGVEDADKKVGELEQEAAKRKARWEELAREAPPAKQ